MATELLTRQSDGQLEYMVELAYDYLGYGDIKDAKEMLTQASRQEQTDA